MKRLALLTLAAVLAGAAALRPDPEREAVAQAVYDYVDALYHVDPARIARSVHPDLAKRGFVRDPDGTYRELRMTYDELVDLAGRWNRDRRVDPATAPREVAVLDVLDQTATAKLTAAWGVDHLHLAKYDGRWQIVNVLWQVPPPPVAPRRFTHDDFQALRWLEGDWRGRGEDGPPFFERYRFTGDSTLVITYYDATFTRATGTGRVFLRDGAIYHESGGARWVATRLDAGGVHFDPVEGARNRFTWTPGTADAWTALLLPTVGAAQEQVLYRMERVRP